MIDPQDPLISVPRHAELLERVINQAMQDLLPLKFNVDSKQHLLLGALYCTILQSMKECCALLAEPTITAPAIIRTIVESHADLCAVIADARHVDRMHATFCKEKKRHLSSILSTPANPYHADLATKIDPVAELTKVNAELAELDARGSKPMSTEDRFKFAGLSDIYRSYYWQLCLDSHNSAVALDTRHIERKADGLGLVAIKPNSPSDIWGYLDVMAAVLLDASVKLHQFLASSSADAFVKWQEELDRLRVVAYPEEATKGIHSGPA